MDIIGNGVDIVENKRIKNSLKIKGFVNRVFTQNEINKSKNLNNKTNYFAKRFAAKEALSKAIGSGLKKGLSFKDISIVNDKFGKPYYEINNNIKKLIYRKLKVKKIKIFLSLADEKNYSIAFSVIHRWLVKIQ